MDGEIFVGVFVGFVVGTVLAIISMVGTSTNNVNRALSCMAAGNTVAQCQDILGVTPH